MSLLTVHIIKAFHTKYINMHENLKLLFTQTIIVKDNEINIFQKNLSYGRI